MPTSLLIIHRGGDQLRGSEEALLTLLAGFDSREFEPLVVCNSQVFAEALSARGFETLKLNLPEIFVAPGDVRLPIVDYLRTLRKLKSIARRRGVRAVVSSGGGPCQLAVPLARSLAIPSLCLLHHPALRSLHFWWMTRHVGTLIFASRFTAEHTQQKTGRTGHVLHIGIDLKRYAPPASRDPALRHELRIDSSDVVFAQIGALVPEKRHAHLLQAFAIVAHDSTAHLLIIGEGAESVAIRSRIRALGLEDRVHLTGYVPDTLPYFQNVIDVNVLASDVEGLGLVNLHASACELPNVSVSGSGSQETIIHGVTGYLCAANAVEPLADDMLRLANDPGLRNRLGIQGRRFVADNFSSELYSARVQELIRRSISGKVVTLRALDARRAAGIS